MDSEWSNESLNSPVYAILAGSSQTAFYLHTGIASHHSPVLRALFSSSANWEENKSRKISWEQWDEATVGRFIRFLYTGNYNWPDLPAPLVSSRKTFDRSPYSPTISQASSPISGHGLMTYIAPGPSQTISPIFNGPSKPRMPGLPSLDYSFPAGFDKSAPKLALHVQWLSALSTSDTASETIQLILLCHASLYALALYTQVDSLANLTLGNLVAALLKIHARAHVLKIISLIRYVYTNTPPSDKMRLVVARYCAQNHEVFEVSTLLQEGDDFMIDFMKLILERLRWHEQN